MNAPRISGSVSLMATSLPFAERFSVLAEAGFEGAEIQRIGEAEPDTIVSASRDSGLPVALVNVEMGDLADGGPGLSGVPGREESFRRSFARAAELAIRLGAASVHLAPSRVPAGVGRSECWETYRANIRHAAEAARGAPFSLVIEPINGVDVPGVLLDDIALAAELAREAGIGVLFDVYHLARMGLDPVAEWRRHRALVRHVQVSDAPRRGRPGSGTIDFAAFFKALSAYGYSGWIGAEYAAGVLEQADADWLAAARAQLSPDDTGARTSMETGHVAAILRG